MSSFELLEKSEKFVNDACSRYNYLRHYYVNQRLAEMNEPERKEALRNLLNESLLLRKMEVSPQFYRMMTRKISRLGWAKRHIHELGFIVLLDVLYPHDLTMKDLVNLKKDTDRRDFQRLIYDYYPEFFIPQEKAGLKDKRKTPIKSIFSDVTVPKLDWEKDVDIIAMMMSEDDFPQLYGYNNWQAGMELNYVCRLVDPDELGNLVDFSNYLKNLPGRIQDLLGKNDKDKDWLKKQLANRGFTIDILYQMLFRAVAIKWFRKTIKTDAEARQLFEHPYMLVYSDLDAQRAVSLNLEWLEDSAKVCNVIQRGADAYYILGRPNISIALSKACLCIPDIDKYDEGLSNHNLAWYNFVKKNYREALTYYLQALDIFSELKSDYDLGVTWAFLAETYFQLGDNSAYQLSIKLSEDYLLKPDIALEKRGRGWLYVADCAQRVDNRQWEQRALSLGVRSLQDSEDIELFAYLHQRLLDSEAGKQTKIAEFYDRRKLRHPPEFVTFRPGPTAFIPILPEREKRSTSK